MAVFRAICETGENSFRVCGVWHIAKHPDWCVRVLGVLVAITSAISVAGVAWVLEWCASKELIGAANSDAVTSSATSVNDVSYTSGACSFGGCNDCL